MIILFFLIFAQSKLDCGLITIKDAYFDIQQLKNDVDYQFEFDDAQKKKIIYYNYCNLITHQCKEQSSFASVYLKENKTQCQTLTTDTLNEGFSYELLANNQPEKGLSLIFKNLNSQIQFNLICNPKIKTQILQELLVDENFYVANIQTIYGCPKVVETHLWKFFINHNITFGIVMMIIGIYLSFAGFKYLLPSLYFSGFSFSLVFFLEVIQTYILNDLQDQKQAWTCCIISILFGCLFGFIAISIPRFGFFSLGFQLGTIFSFLLHNSILYMVPCDPPEFSLIIEVLILGSFFGMLSCCFWRQIVILSTSFLGSYLFFRGISMMAGGFPAEISLNKQILYNQIEKPPSAYYAYFALIIIMGLFTNWLQKRQKRLREKQKNNESQENDEEEQRNLDLIQGKPVKIQKKDLEQSLMDLEMSSINNNETKRKQIKQKQKKNSDDDKKTVNNKKEASDDEEEDDIKLKQLMNKLKKNNQN